MPVDDLESRKSLSFLQAEGAEPLPTQLERSAMPRSLRAKLWRLVYSWIEAYTCKGTQDRRYHTLSRNGYSYNDIWGEIEEILRDEYVEHSHGFMHNFSNDAPIVIKRLEPIFSKGSYLQIYSFLQYVLRHKKCPEWFAAGVDAILIEERSAFRIVENNTFVPVATEEEHRALTEALGQTKTDEFIGSHTHLRNAAQALTNGQFPDSVRESIHAVEAIARTLEPSAELSKALNKLEKSSNLHAAMKKGFAALYGYTSDENGIRHPLLDKGDANVDEADAVFMIGACASFVSYLISKKRSAGIASDTE